MSLSRDPIINVIENGFKKELRVVMENECYRSAIILVYAIIDAMAFLSSPKEHITRKEFIEWCDEYIRVIGVDENKLPYRLPGIDLYGARCSLIHTYGYKLESSLSKKGTCSKIGYSVRRIDQRIIPSHSATQCSFAIVSICDLVDSLFKGIDDFMTRMYKDKDIKSNKERIEVFEKKLKSFIHEL